MGRDPQGGARSRGEAPRDSTRPRPPSAAGRPRKVSGNATLRTAILIMTNYSFFALEASLTLYLILRISDYGCILSTTIFTCRHI